MALISPNRIAFTQVSLDARAVQKAATATSIAPSSTGSSSASSSSSQVLWQQYQSMSQVSAHFSRHRSSNQAATAEAQESPAWKKSAQSLLYAKGNTSLYEATF